LTKSKTRDSSLAQLEPNEWRPLARLWHLHARLFLSAAFGVAVTLILLAVPWPMPARVLIGWDSGVALYLALAYRAAAHASVANRPDPHRNSGWSQQVGRSPDMPTRSGLDRANVSHRPYGRSGISAHSG